MSRFRSRSRSRFRWAMLPVWGIGACVIGWGLWQLSSLRQSLLAEAHPAATASESPSPSAISPTSAPGAGAKTQAANSGSADPFDRSAIPISQPGLMALPIPSVPDATIDIGPTDDPEEIKTTLARGHQYLDHGQIVEGRRELNSILPSIMDSPAGALIRSQLASLNGPVFLGSALLPDDDAAPLVSIRSGDSFLRIARQYSIPVELLQQLNPSLNSRHLKPADGIKVVRGPFNMTLVKHAHRLDLFARDSYVGSYPVTLEEGNYLPIGSYRIRSNGKIQVGEKRWLGFAGTDMETRDVERGWIYGSYGPRNDGSDHASGIQLQDNYLEQLYNVLVETRSLLHVQA